MSTRNGPSMDLSPGSQPRGVIDVVSVNFIVISILGNAIQLKTYRVRFTRSNLKSGSAVRWPPNSRPTLMNSALVARRYFEKS